MPKDFAQNSFSILAPKYIAPLNKFQMILPTSPQKLPPNFSTFLNVSTRNVLPHQLLSDPQPETHRIDQHTMGDCAYDNVATAEGGGAKPPGKEAPVGRSFHAVEGSSSSHRAEPFVPLRPVMKRQKSVILPQQEDSEDGSIGLVRE